MNDKPKKRKYTHNTAKKTDTSIKTKLLDFFKNKKRICYVIAGLIVVVAISLIVFINVLSDNPRMRVGKALQIFSQKTVNEPDYIFYDLNPKELLSLYAGSDITFEGKATISDLQEISIPLNASIHGARSYDQQQMYADVDLSAFIFGLPTIYTYINHDNLFIYSDGLNLAYKFPVTQNLYPEINAPSQNPGKSWLNQNKDNIANLVKKVPIRKTGNKITTTDGDKAEEFEIILPKGEGDFIWKIFGGASPNKDVTVLLYINDDNRICRVELDLTNLLSIEGTAKLTLEGKHASTLIFEGSLADQGTTCFTMTRTTEESRYFKIDIKGTDLEGTYHVSGAIAWTNKENGLSLNIKNMKVENNDETVVNIDYQGTISYSDPLPDLFEGLPAPEESFEEMEWDDLINTIANEVSI